MGVGDEPRRRYGCATWHETRRAPLSSDDDGNGVSAHRLRYESTSPTGGRFGMDVRAETTRFGPTSPTQMSSECAHSGLHYRAGARPKPNRVHQKTKQGDGPRRYGPSNSGLPWVGS